MQAGGRNGGKAMAEREKRRVTPPPCSAVLGQHVSPGKRSPLFPRGNGVPIILRIRP